MGDRFEFPIGERTLEAEWHGARPEDAPTLILLHEGLGSVAAWRDWPAELAAKSNLGVLVYSRFGYGASSPAELPRPVSYMHEEAHAILPAVIEQSGARDFVLVGHSDGASIAILYAGSDHASQLLRGLVLMSPHVLVEDIAIASIEGARAAFATTDLEARLAKYHRDPQRAFRGWNDVWLHPDFRGWNIESYVPNVRVPMLSIQEAGDPYGTLAQIDAIERAATTVTKRLILPGRGHAPWKDARESSTRAVVDFAREVLPAPA